MFELPLRFNSTPTDRFPPGKSTGYQQLRLLRNGYVSRFWGFLLLLNPKIPGSFTRRLILINF